MMRSDAEMTQAILPWLGRFSTWEIARILGIGEGTVHRLLLAMEDQSGETPASWVAS